MKIYLKICLMLKKDKKELKCELKRLFKVDKKVNKKPIVKVIKIMQEDKDPYSYTEEAP